MDNPWLTVGTTVFIPVHAKGALFQVGDGHAAQGEGEADQTGLETSLTGTFRFIVRKDLKNGVINPEIFRAIHELSALRQMAITSALSMAPYFHPRMGALAAYEPVNRLPMQSLDD